MEPRSRIPSVARRVALAASLGALLVPAVAQAAPAASAAKAASKPPVVTSVSPSKAAVGDKLTIRGRYFRPGKGKNSVIFQRPGSRAVFVKADLATTKMLTVRLPKTLERFLVVKTGQPQPTVFRVRIMADRLGKAFTPASLSPTISPTPAKPVAAPGPGPVAPVDPEKSGSSYADGDCDADGVKNGADTDDDEDLLADTVETTIKLDACKADTDGDGVQDGYEYRSARDLNDDEYEEPNTFLPYPGKRPYPNPLDGSDANVDFDGDTLTLSEEQALWLYSSARGVVRSLENLTYSDGMQHSVYTRGADGRRLPTLPAAGYPKQQCFLDWADPAVEDTCIPGDAEHGYRTVHLSDVDKVWFAPRKPHDIRDFDRDGVVSETPKHPWLRAEATYYDHDGDGWLSDDERDEDADGMTNFQEAKHCMSRKLWDGLYDKEIRYYRAYSGTDLADEDSDGDGVRDGADDQDADDVPNVMECSRRAASDRPLQTKAGVPNPSPAWGQVNPFNPCLPHRHARTCNANPPVGEEWAPFQPDAMYYLVLN